MINRIGIMGAGAIGCVVGGMLTKSGRDVTLIDQWPDHVEAMKKVGLRLSGTCGEHLVPVKALHIHELQSVTEPFDAIFLSVKSYDTQWATALALNYLAPEGVVVDFQNGLNDERVAAVAGKARTLGCVITIGAGMYEPGHAIRTDTGAIGFKIGEHDGRVTDRAREVAELMNAVATTEVTTNLFGERWSKLAINCMANPLAGLTGLGSAEVRIDPKVSAVGIHLGAEVIMVGRAVGHEVEPIYGIETQRFVDAYQGRGLRELLADVADIARKRGGGRPSLLQDVIRGRRTEIEFLNGAVCEHGKQVGIKTPYNDAVVGVVRGLGVGFKPDPKHLAPVIAMLPA
jgi:2-dehydropantoate 2-reductase